MIVDKIKLEEIQTKSNNILILEGTIYNEKIRIILTYMDCCKEFKGGRYKENREIQREIENFMEVEPGVKLICMGDFNGRMKTTRTQDWKWPEW